MKFYLGTHRPYWLDKVNVPLMVSRRTLAGRKTLPKAIQPWVLDSGGFTELNLFGGWSVPAAVYAAELRRLHDEVGQLEWAAGQDWMCEPWILTKTGKTVDEHIALTVGNYIDLKTWAPELPFIPTLQGWSLADYLRCFDAYEDAGVNLADQPTVGLGSVCRRQNTDEIGTIVRTFARRGLKLHGFGCKAGAIRRYGEHLHSADSMAWSFNGRKVRPCPMTGVSSCNNCVHFALDWRERLLSQPIQLSLDGVAA